MDLLVIPKLLSESEARHWVNTLKQMGMLNGIESQNSFYGREHGYKIEIEVTNTKGIVIRLAESTGYQWIDEMKLVERYPTPEEMATAYGINSFEDSNHQITGTPPRSVSYEEAET